MSRIKVIAFDVYDTILCGDDSDNVMPPRQGFVEFVLRVKRLGIKMVTSSDADLTNLQLDLAATFRNGAPFGPEVFDAFFKLSMRPKRYGEILRYFGIIQEELMIIGDRQDNDIAGAPPGSVTILVPPYDFRDRLFSFTDIQIP